MPDSDLRLRMLRGAKAKLAALQAVLQNKPSPPTGVDGVLFHSYVEVPASTRPDILLKLFEQIRCFSSADPDAHPQLLQDAEAHSNAIQAVMGGLGLPDGVDADLFQMYASNVTEEKHLAILSELFTLISLLSGASGRSAAAIPQDPIELLANADTSCSPEKWILSYPMIDDQPPMIANLSMLQKLFADAEARVLHELPHCGDIKGAMLLGIQAAMGTGKSHAIDVAEELLFRGKNPIVLKVSYGSNQSLLMEKRKPENGFLARLILALRRQVSPYSDTLVKKAISLDSDALTTENVVRWIRSNHTIGAHERPIIIAVDELAALSADTDVCRDVRLELGRVMAEILSQSNGTQLVIGLVTALPNTDLQSWSTRQPVIVHLDSLTMEESEMLLKHCCKTAQPNSSQLRDMQVMCGGHPRSLASAARLFCNSSPVAVPSPNDVTLACMWRVREGETAGVVLRAIREAYLQGDRRLGGPSLAERPALQHLHNDAMLLTVRETRFTIPVTLLYTDEGHPDFFQELHQMLACQPSDAPTKSLRCTNYHWEFFKALHELPVIPPSMAQKGDPEYFFCFTPKATDCLQQTPILAQDGGVREEFLALDDESFSYRDTANHHRAFEAMCLASTKDGASNVLCLFQSKINGDVGAAIDELNAASGELKSMWEGEFLFIVFALDSPPTTDSAQRAMDRATSRTILVQRQNLADYFTATLAPAAELCLLRHN